MANEDREVLFSNERFLIGVQVVSVSALLAAVTQRDAFTTLAGKTGYVLFMTAMVLALVAAILATFWKHSYKMWDVRADASAAQARFAKSVNDDNGFGVHSRDVTSARPTLESRPAIDAAGNEGGYGGAARWLWWTGSGAVDRRRRA